MKEYLLTFIFMKNENGMHPFEYKWENPYMNGQNIQKMLEWKALVYLSINQPPYKDD